jgi:5-methyltetrahydrofolate--homocysteine methyltransferase
MNTRLQDILRKRPLLVDGAMGTMIQQAGKAGGCNEELCLTQPDIIADIHRAYIQAGADILTTNTFGATSIVLADHGMADKVREINLAAAKIARQAADAATKRKAYVAGEVGPTSKLPTLGHISFDQLFGAYAEQIEVLIDGGVDLILIATCQDPLQAKTAAAAASQVFERRGSSLPLCVSVTVEQIGTMLLGTELSAALASLAPYGPFAFGLNCATGPQAMEEHLQLLCNSSPFPLLCRPNAGIPESVEGVARYPLGPQEFAEVVAEYTRRFGIALVGGCCGTNPDHIAQLSRRLAAIPAKHFGQGQLLSRPKRTAALSGLYSAVALDQEPKPFIAAEQTNVNGSRQFRKLLEEDNFDSMAEVGRQSSAASHALDICVAYPGRDEVADIQELARRLAVKAEGALMIDSTNPQAVKAALEASPGRAVINSINLEDGGEGARRLLACARRFGAAVVGLTIDEKGMARDVGHKLLVAGRLVDVVADAGLSIDDLLIDPLTFTLASGDAGLRDAGVKTLEALRRIKKEIPGARTILGVSNISYGLSPHGRRFLTSVFLHRALNAGLDAAIINPARIAPLNLVPQEAVKLCHRLIDADSSGGDPLAAFIEYLQEMKGEARLEPAVIRKAASPEERLRESVIAGTGSDLSSVIEDLLRGTPPQEIIDRILLPAMQEVGRRFGRGELALPFVLASAEAMRRAIDLLAPHMKASEEIRKGTIVLATVRGDVHDIGKNLVDIILSNNGFRVINLGIRQPALTIMEAVRQQGADAIGLSGLLVSSTEVMRQDLVAFRDGGIDVPVLCGGAALTPSFVKNTLAPTYGGRVYYCADAFAGLSAMEKVAKKLES